MDAINRHIKPSTESEIGNVTYCDDKELIRSMIGKDGNGLDPMFMDRWIDGKTVFMAWW